MDLTSEQCATIVVTVGGGDFLSIHHLRNEEHRSRLVEQEQRRDRLTEGFNRLQNLDNPRTCP